MKQAKKIKLQQDSQIYSKEKIAVVKELHKPARVNYPRRRTIIKGLDDLWQADLAEFTLYAKENKGFKYVLVIIDAFSKYVWNCALKDKTGVNVTKAFEKVLKQSGRIPTNLQTDQGKEFYNSSFSKLMKTYNINHYSSYSIKKASIAERVIRTLKTKIYKAFSLRGKYVYYDKLQHITSEYNSTRHRTTGMRPCDIDKNNEQLVLKQSYNYMKIAGKRKFKVGDTVRISKQKAAFDKSYTPNWSTELFQIYKIKLSNPTVYYLRDRNGNDVKGAFYEQELQNALYKDVYLVEKIERRKGDKAYVKWLGFDKTHNSWIDKSQLI